MFVFRVLKNDKSEGSRKVFNPLTPKILTVNSLFLLRLNSLQTSYENLL